MTVLMDKLKQSSNEMRVKKGIDDNLPYASIVNRVKVFIQNLEGSNLAYAYGNTDFDDPHLTSETIYDPIAFLEADPDQFEQLQHMVSHDLEHYLDTLLTRKKNCAHSYNILVFGCAIYVYYSKPLPEKLQSFLVEHLLDPHADLKKSQIGRRKRPETETRLIGAAVSFAKNHGLTATRNDASVKKVSACDAVGEAVSELMREKRTKFSCSNYDAIQKIWQKYKKLPT